MNFSQKPFLSNSAAAAEALFPGFSQSIGENNDDICNNLRHLIVDRFSIIEKIRKKITSDNQEAMFDRLFLLGFYSQSLENKISFSEENLFKILSIDVEILIALFAQIIENNIKKLDANESLYLFVHLEDKASLPEPDLKRAYDEFIEKLPRIEKTSPLLPQNLHAILREKELFTKLFQSKNVNSIFSALKKNEAALFSHDPLDKHDIITLVDMMNEVECKGLSKGSSASRGFFPAQSSQDQKKNSLPPAPVQPKYSETPQIIPPDLVKSPESITSKSSPIPTSLPHSLEDYHESIQSSITSSAAHLFITYATKGEYQYAPSYFLQTLNRFARENMGYLSSRLIDDKILDIQKVRSLLALSRSKNYQDESFITKLQWLELIAKNEHIIKILKVPKSAEKILEETIIAPDVQHLPQKILEIIKKEQLIETFPTHAIAEGVEQCIELLNQPEPSRLLLLELLDRETIATLQLTWIDAKGEPVVFIDKLKWLEALFRNESSLIHKTLIATKMLAKNIQYEILEGFLFFPSTENNALLMRVFAIFEQMGATHQNKWPITLLAGLQNPGMFIQIYESSLDRLFTNNKTTTLNQSTEDRQWLDDFFILPLLEEISKSKKASTGESLDVITDTYFLWGDNVDNNELKNLMTQTLDALFDARPTMTQCYFVLYLNSKSHWISIFVDLKKPAPRVYWLDSRADEPSSSDINRLITILNGTRFIQENHVLLLNSHIVPQTFQLQKDGYNCAAWTVSIFEYTQAGQILPIPPDHNIDIKFKRQQYSIMLDKLNGNKNNENNNTTQSDNSLSTSRFKI